MKVETCYYFELNAKELFLVKKERDNRAYDKFSSLKLYFFIFIISGVFLCIFYSFKTFLFVEFLQNKLVETHFHNITILRLLFILVLTGVLTAFIAFLRHLSLIHIDKLGSAARKIARGDFSIRVIPPGKNRRNRKSPIDLLYDDFNRMTEELAELNKELKALSITDELTKLDNRRSFLEYIDILWRQSHRLHLPITVLMIDVDYFKKYNDSLGHLEGDKALISISKCLKNQINRETDFIARFGGEEFVCLLPFIEKDKAVEFVQTLVKSVEEMKIPHPMSECSKYLTVSVGMATVIPNENNNYNKLLDDADKALYKAKETGRNRIVMY
jgi:diguanylate cyclase (GGDEF)-like protein